jgi:hypothetical protein
MDAVGILEAASLLVPEGVATDNDVIVSDVWDYLAHDEWEVALDLLQELGDGWTAPTGFWDELELVAGMLGLERSRERLVDLAKGRLTCGGAGWAAFAVRTESAACWMSPARGVAAMPLRRPVAGHRRTGPRTPCRQRPGSAPRSRATGWM